MQKFLLFYICLLASLTTLAQGGNLIWYFGNAGVDFNTSPPTALYNSAMFASGGCATLTDELGNLLMYTNGAQMFNRQHQQMPDGFGLMGSIGSTQTAIFLPYPGTDSLYLVFNTGTGNYGFAPYGYSVIDLTLDRKSVV